MRTKLFCLTAAVVLLSLVANFRETQSKFAIIPTASAETPTFATDIKLRPGDWPWWRGPQVDGATAVQSTPTVWSNTQNILWKADIPGRGHSSPILVDGNVFLTTAEDEGQVQSLHCLDFASGHRRWAIPLHRGQFPTKHPDNTHASATPASDGRYVFTAFGNKDGVWLSAVDLNGNVIWSKNTGPYPSEHGFGASVCLHGNLVFVAGEALKTGFIGAFDRATGNEVWRNPREPDREHANYATPVVVELAGRSQLIIPGWHLVSSYNPETGALLWENPGPADVNSNCIAVQDPYLIVSGGFPQKKIICIKADVPEGDHGRKVIWESTKNVAWVPSPLIHDDRVLIMSDSGVLSDLKLKTGEFLWTQRMSGPAYASPIRVGNLFIATTRDGHATVFKSTDKFEKLAENDLGDGGGNATPVVSDNKILIRTDHSLFCVGEN